MKYVFRNVFEVLKLANLCLGIKGHFYDVGRSGKPTFNYCKQLLLQHT